MYKRENMDLTDKEEFLSNEDVTNLQNVQENASDQPENTDNVAYDFDALKKKYDELNDSHLRLMAEFDNYRKRTLREKAELIKNGGETVLSGLLPVIDDFERALLNIRTANNMEAVVEGVDLIYNKFMLFLSQQGIKPIEAIGQPFDTETFEAVAIIPTPEENMKGKVIDSAQTGYTLYDKVIRHAKVVVGE
jgi:molecular chaperone GrpE